MDRLSIDIRWEPHMSLHGPDSLRTRVQVTVDGTEYNTEFGLPLHEKPDSQLVKRIIADSTRSMFDLMQNQRPDAKLGTVLLRMFDQLRGVPLK